MQLKDRSNIQPQCHGFEPRFCHTKLTLGKNSVGQQWEGTCAGYVAAMQKPVVSEVGRGGVWAATPSLGWPEYLRQIVVDIPVFHLNVIFPKPEYLRQSQIFLFLELKNQNTFDNPKIRIIYHTQKPEYLRQIILVYMVQTIDVVK